VEVEGGNGVVKTDDDGSVEESMTGVVVAEMGAVGVEVTLVNDCEVMVTGVLDMDVGSGDVLLLVLACMDVTVVTCSDVAVGLDVEGGRVEIVTGVEVAGEVVPAVVGTELGDVDVVGAEVTKVDETVMLVGKDVDVEEGAADDSDTVVVSGVVVVTISEGDVVGVVVSEKEVVAGVVEEIVECDDDGSVVSKVPVETTECGIVVPVVALVTAVGPDDDEIDEGFVKGAVVGVVVAVKVVLGTSEVETIEVEVGIAVMVEMMV
jgi:hypothetical protein